MRLIILFFILFEVNICAAQSYTHFPDSNVRWSEYSYLFGALPGTSYHNYHGYFYDLGNDTIIDGHEYILVGSQSTFYYQLVNPGGLITVDNYPINPPGEIFGAIREDSDKKVWFRKLADENNVQPYCDATNDFPFGQDILLYDFDVHLGDVVSWKHGEKTVISIDSVQFDDGIFRKRYYFGGSFGLFKEYWIEGMGSTLGLFGAYGGLPSSYGSCQLDCFWKDGDYIFHYLSPSWLSCDQYVGIDNVDAVNQIKIYPNPASDRLNISFGNAGYHSIQIKDIAGKTLIIENSYFQNSILEISSLKPGMYFIVIMNSKKELLRQRIVKI